jgi:hypothetical protein
MGMGRRFSSVVLSSDVVRVRMGWAFSADIPRRNITSMTEAHGPVLGWGVHGWRGRWLVNGSSKGLVTIAIDPRVPARVCFVPIKLRAVTVSLVNPDVLLSQQA